MASRWSVIEQKLKRSKMDVDLKRSVMHTIHWLKESKMTPPTQDKVVGLGGEYAAIFWTVKDSYVCLTVPKSVRKKPLVITSVSITHKKLNKIQNDLFTILGKP